MDYREAYRSPLIGAFFVFSLMLLVVSQRGQSLLKKFQKIPRFSLKVYHILPFWIGKVLS